MAGYSSASSAILFASYMIKFIWWLISALPINSSCLDFSPFEIATTCIMMSRELNGFENSWNSNLEKVYGIKKE